MNRIRQGLWALGLLVVVATAQAQFSSTITGTSDYDFRGFSQSAKDPALQASLDYAWASGFAVGAWASNVDFGDGVDADVELDYYANYTRAINDDLGWTVGAVFYSYPGSDDVKTYHEVFAGINAGKFAFKQWYSDDLFEINVGSAWYSEGNATFELPNNFSLLLHAGYAWGDYWKDSGGELFDYMVGVGYTLGNFDLNLKFTGTDASGAQKITSDANNNEGRLVLSIATTLPWGKEE